MSFARALPRQRHDVATAEAARIVQQASLAGTPLESLSVTTQRLYAVATYRLEFPTWSWESAHSEYYRQCVKAQDTDAAVLALIAAIH